MKKIQKKVYRDLKKRREFQVNEITKREALSIRKAEILRGSEAWMFAIEKLNTFGGLGSITKVRNLCKYTGRTKGVLVKYGMSRMEWRRYADKGEIPGIRRASW